MKLTKNYERLYRNFLFGLLSLNEDFNIHATESTVEARLGETHADRILFYHNFAQNRPHVKVEINSKTVYHHPLDDIIYLNQIEEAIEILYSY